MDSAQQERIMINGRVHLSDDDAAIEINRGMMIFTEDGDEAGVSAGVVVSQDGHEADYVLLGRLPVTAEYRLIPISLIAGITQENIHLNVNCDEIMRLHLHQPLTR